MILKGLTVWWVCTDPQLNKIAKIPSTLTEEEAMEGLKNFEGWYIPHPI